MNPTGTLQPNQWGFFPVSGQDAAAPPEPAAIHGTATLISDPAQAYIAAGRVDGQICIIPRVPAPEGGSFLVSVKIDATDAASGNALPSIQLDVTVQGATQVAQTIVVGAFVTETPLQSNRTPPPGAGTWVHAGSFTF